MRRNCVTCDRPTIQAREIDNNIKVIDSVPEEAGRLVLLNADQDEPTVIWGVPVGQREELAWGQVVEADAPRYDLHVCELPSALRAWGRKHTPAATDLVAETIRWGAELGIVPGKSWATATTSLIRHWAVHMANIQQATLPAGGMVFTRQAKFDLEKAIYEVNNGR